MGRISDIIPPLYFTGKNDLKGFLDALDIEIDGLETKVKGITDLIDVDRCPDDRLPYLAALTNCPLVGEDPVMWRRQIRLWPYLLKIKGTELSFDVYLNSIGATDHRIPTYFRDADGEYVEEKPEGEPFLAEDGLWRNIRTHYFGLETYWNGEAYLHREDWNDDFVERVSFWFQRMKPFHAELLHWDTYIDSGVTQPLTVGMAIAQAPYQKVRLELPTTGKAGLTVKAGGALAQSIRQKVRLEQPTSGKAESRLFFGVGLSQGHYQKIRLKQPSSGYAKSVLRAGVAVVSSIYTKIKMRDGGSGGGNRPPEILFESFGR